MGFMYNEWFPTYLQDKNFTVHKHPKHMARKLCEWNEFFHAVLCLYWHIHKIM